MNKLKTANALLASKLYRVYMTIFSDLFLDLFS